MAGRRARAVEQAMAPALGSWEALEAELEGDQDAGSVGGMDDDRSDIGPSTRRRVSGARGDYAKSETGSVASSGTGAGGGGGAAAGGGGPASSVIPQVASRIAHLQRGAVVRIADFPNHAQRSDDTWAPEGPCEQTLMENGLVKSRKRQHDDKCRVIGCPAGAAARSPFMCDYHGDIGMLYVVVSQAGSWAANMKLCNRCHRWEWLRNFARRSGKYNLTCRACCSKANYRNRKGGNVFMSVMLTIDTSAVCTLDVSGDTTLTECREKYIPEATTRNIRHLLFLVRGAPLGLDQESLVRVRECLDPTVEDPTLCMVRPSGLDSTEGPGAEAMSMVSDHFTAASESQRSYHMVSGSVDDRSIASQAPTEPAIDSSRLIPVDPRNGPMGRLWFGSDDCEAVLVQEGILKPRVVAPASSCRVRGCCRLVAGLGALCEHHTESSIYIAKLERERVFVVYDGAQQRYRWLGLSVGGGASPVPDDMADADASPAAVVPGGGTQPISASSSTPLRAIAISLLDSFVNFAASLNVSAVTWPVIPSESATLPAIATFCVSLLEAVKDLNSRQEVREYLDAIQPGRAVWEECVGDSQFTLQQLASATGCRKVVRELTETQNMSGLLGPIAEAVDLEDPVAAARQLVQAASWGNEGFVRQLVEGGQAVDGTAGPDYTALMAACRCGYPRIVQYLLSAGADPNRVSRDGQAPLAFAARIGSFEIVRHLADAGAHIDHADMFGYSALMRAARSGHAHIVKFLAARGAAVDRMCAFNGYTALLWTAVKGHMQAARELLAAGANVHIANVFGETALSWAKFTHHSGMIALLTKAARETAPLPLPAPPVVSLAAVAASLQSSVRDLITRLGLEPPALIHVPAESESSPAAYHEFCNQLFSIMKTLNNWPAVRAHLDGISSSSSVWDQCVSAEGLSLLQFATEVGCTAVVQELRENGAVQYMLDGAQQLNCSVPEVRLLRAASQNNVAIAAQLMEQGVDVNCRVGREGYTPLMAAARCGHAEVAAFLLRNGANVNMTSSHGHSPLILAGTNAHLNVVDLLVQHGADVNSTDLYGSVLVRAARYGHLDVVEYLLNHSADVNLAGPYNGLTALMWAATRGDLAMTQLLVNRGANVHAEDQFGDTAQAYAARGNFYDVVRLLQSQGAAGPPPTEETDTTPGEPPVTYGDAAMLRTPGSEELGLGSPVDVDAPMFADLPPLPDIDL